MSKKINALLCFLRLVWCISVFCNTPQLSVCISVAYIVRGVCGGEKNGTS